MNTNKSGNYKVFNGNGDIFYIPYKYKHIYALEAPWNPHVVHPLMVNYWHYSLWIVFAYVVLIHLGQKLMLNRKPFNLKTSLFLWNSFLALFSIFGAYRIAEEFFHVLLTRGFQDSVCLTMNPYEPITFWAFLFLMSKVFELFDTAFIVLRKRSLIFLHWYHHAVVLISVTHSATAITAASRWFMMMNTFVHSLMYTYYAISSLGYRVPRAISMVVTTLQTSQMLVGVGITIYVARHKLLYPNVPCQQTGENILLCFAIYTTFAVLFINFFIKTYGGKKSGKSAKATLVSNGVKAKSNGNLIIVLNEKDHLEKKIE